MCIFSSIRSIVIVVALVYSGTLHAGSQNFGNGWSCYSFIYGGDVWVRSYYNYVGIFDFRVGAGGAMSELRDIRYGLEALLAQRRDPFELTDGNVQTTAWSFSLQSPPGIVPPPDFNRRWNITQAGNLYNTFSPTISVSMDPNSCSVWVYSVPQDQWYPENQPYISGKVSQYVRYDVGPSGEIYIHRVVLAGQPYQNGSPVPYGTPFYLEAWSPFNVPLFDQLVLSHDGAGYPNWWYGTHNIPNYPEFPLASTYGYATVYRYGDPLNTQRNVSLVFGRQDLCWYENGNCGTPPAGSRYVLNSLRIDGPGYTAGIAILPGVFIGQGSSTLPVGAVFDQRLVLLPGTFMDGGRVTWLHTMASQIPRLRVIPPWSAIPSEIAGIVAALRANESATGVRTDQLAPLVQ